jgi:hypothetical protein
MSRQFKMVFTWYHFGEKFNYSGSKNETKRKACGLENQDVRQGPRLFLSLFFLGLVLNEIVQNGRHFVH